MSRCIQSAPVWLSLWGALLLLGCGGGTDVGNPYYQPITGTVMSRTSDGVKASGARLVLARRGVDPGLKGSNICAQKDDLSFCFNATFFDTTYTDVNGQFRFEEKPPAEYALVASYNNLVTLEYIAHGSYEEDVVNLVVTDPVTVTVKNYTTIDMAQPHFIGAGVAGTEFTGIADTNGEITLHNIPAADSFTLFLYRNDSRRMAFTGLKTYPGCEAELYTLPELSVDKWTPHSCGIREPLGLPYILDYLAVDPGDPQSELLEYDLQIRFSHAMDVLSTGNAIHAEADGDSVAVESLWWQGANTVYLKYCTFDTTGSCRTGNDRFLQGVTYGVTIDTSAQTALGVHFAYEAYVRFVPIP